MSDFASRSTSLPKSRLAIAGVDKPGHDGGRSDHYEVRYENVVSVIRNTGTLIRFSFYAAGLLGFGLISLSISRVFGTVSFYKVEAVNEGPSFRLVDGELARLSTRTKVTSSGAAGRTETRNYGQPHDRNTNLTVTLTLTPKVQTGMSSMFAEIRNSVANAAFAGSAYGSARYDLETRFGRVHAAETSITADGLIKPCLSFQSRFATEVVKLEGTYCEATGAKPSPSRLACMLDGLVLEARLASAEADAFLRGRMAQRPYCTSTPVSQTMDTQSRSVSPPSRWSVPSANRR
jgi:hypothetical protein